MIMQKVFNKVCGLDAPLSAINYHNLLWDFPDDLQSSLSNLRIAAKLSKIKSGKIPSIYYLDQHKAESYYRLIDSISFTINPKNYSVDCYENVAKIQKRLLTTLGTDDVLLNNPEFFDKSYESFQKIERIKTENKALQAELQEKRRSINDKAICDREKDLYLNRFTFKLDQSPEPSSRDCLSYSVDSDSNCESFNAMTSDDTNNEDLNLIELFIWAQQFINDQLIVKKVERDPNNIMNLMDGDSDLDRTGNLTTTVSSETMNRRTKKSTHKRKPVTPPQEVVEVVKPKKWGCFKQ